VHAGEWQCWVYTWTGVQRQSRQRLQIRDSSLGEALPQAAPMVLYVRWTCAGSASVTRLVTVCRSTLHPEASQQWLQHVLVLLCQVIVT
jgi:hypothetical protein